MINRYSNANSGIGLTSCQVSHRRVRTPVLDPSPVRIHYIEAFYQNKICSDSPEALHNHSVTRIRFLRGISLQSVVFKPTRVSRRIKEIVLCTFDNIITGCESSTTFTLYASIPIVRRSSTACSSVTNSSSTSCSNSVSNSSGSVTSTIGIDQLSVLPILE